MKDINVELSNALYEEYKKSYDKVEPGDVYPKWFDDEQLKWIENVFNKHVSNTK